MRTQKDIDNIFKMLHDGTIESWEGYGGRLVLKVSCLYLAELIDEGFEYFYVEMTDIRKIEFIAWKNSIDKEQEIFTEFADIFKADIEILSADEIKDGVLVVCNRHDKKFDYCGGNLTINSSHANVFDHDKNPLTIDELEDVCKQYWEKFSGRKSR